MNKELDEFNMKKVILDTWKSKLSYPLNHNDIEELERIIDYYEEQIQELRNILDEIGLNPNEILYLKQENMRLQKKIDKVIEELDELLVYNYFNDTTSSFGNVKETLKFYLSDYETLEEFRRSDRHE